MSIRMILSAAASNYLSTLNKVDIFNDGSGIALYMLEDNALDESGNYNGTATSVTYGAGRFGRAGVFNGSSSYINPNTNLVPLSTTVTSISMWFNYNGNNNFLFGSDNGGTNYIFFTPISARYGTSPATNLAYTPITGWNHIVVVYRGAAAGYSVYLNNVLVGNKTSTDYTGVSYNSMIGCRNSGGGLGDYYSGSIDQVRIFNRALTAGEVSTLYTEI